MFTTTLVRGGISLGIVVFSSPYILVVIIPIAVVYFRVMDIYRHSARELERLTSAGASPIYSMFGETLTGVLASRQQWRCWLSLSMAMMKAGEQTRQDSSD